MNIPVFCKGQDIRKPGDHALHVNQNCILSESFSISRSMSGPIILLKSMRYIGEGNGNPLQYSCLENPRDGGAWWAAVYGVAQSGTWLKRLSSSTSSDYGEGNGTPLQYSCLENPRDREPGGLPSMGSHRVGHDWSDLAVTMKITAEGDCSHKIKRCLLFRRKALTNLDSILKSRDINLLTKVHIVKAMVFTVVMYGYDSWMIKKAECWRIDAFELWC